MKKLINIALSIGCLLLLTGCEGWRDTQALGFEGKTATQIYQQGESAFQAKQYHDAIRSFKTLNRLHPNTACTEAAHCTLIDCYAAVERFEEAIQEINHFIRLYPRSQHIRMLKRKQITLKRQKAIQDIKQQYDNAVQKCRNLESHYREKMKCLYRDLYPKTEWESFKKRNRSQYHAFIKSVESKLGQ